MNEFELIRQYFQQQRRGKGIRLGIGDDCALLQLPSDRQLAVSMDTLVADVHFPADADPALIAQRALRVNLSDLAAVGAEPLWFTLGLTIPDVNCSWLESFSQGLFAAADEFSCMLVGGDTTCGPLSITVQVHGAVDGEKALLRCGAGVGDTVYVTGYLGDGAAALAVIKQALEAGPSERQYFMRHFYCPTPRLAEAAMLGGIASSCIDVSDGLLADLGHICQASKAGAIIDVELLPVSPALSCLVSEEQAQQWASSGGDDYQLCFTVSPSNRHHVESLISRGELQATAIGRVVLGTDVVCRKKGAVLRINKKGYQHFEDGRT